ncbi:hypothetical protein Tco_0323821 [Tanacetum coccineum]
MDDRNITMVVYIRLQTKKAQKNGQTFNWRTATYGKVYCEDFNSFTNFKADFPAIVYNDALTSNWNVLSEPTVEGYTEDIVHNFEQRLDTIFGRQLGGARRRMIWRQFILELGLHTTEEMEDDGFQEHWFGSARAIPDKGDLIDYWAEISFDIDFLGLSPSYIYIKDLVRRLCHRLISCSIFGRGQAPEKPLMIDIDELFKLNICVRIRDTWYWVASGPERQQGAAAGAQEGAAGAHVKIEGD